MSSLKSKLGGAYNPPGTYGGSGGALLQKFYNKGGVQSVEIGDSPADPTIAAPTAKVGVPIPYSLGRFIVSSPNVIWVGNLNPIYDSTSESKTEVEPYYTFGLFGTVIRHEVTTTTVVTTTFIVGYRIDCHIGLCLGPDVKLVGIYYNNEKIWSGSIGPARSTITLPDDDSPVSGATIIFHGGAFDQVVDPTVTDPDMPGYVGVSYVIIQNIRADSPLQNLQFEVERMPNPLALSAGNNSFNSDLNAVSAIADVITNEWGGAGLDIDEVNVANFVANALTVASEQNGCSLIVYGGSVKAMLSALLQQVYGILYQNPETGKLEISLVREGELVFSPDRNFGPTNIVALRNFSKSSWASTISKLSGSFTSRADNYKPASILVQNLASDNISKIDVSNYPYVMNSELALDLLSRDLGLSSAPFFSASIETNRQAATLLPGKIIFLSWNDYHIYGVPILVSKVRKLPMDKNTVIVEGIQYLTPEITPVFEVPATAFDPGIDIEPKGPADVRIITAPFWIARRAGVVTSETSNEVDVPLFLVQPADDLQSSFDTWSTYLADGTTSALSTKYVEQSPYPTYGELSVAIDKYDGWTTGTIPEIVLDGVVNPTNLKEIGVNGAHSGELLLIIDDEIFSFETTANTGPGQYTLYNVKRALVDTVAASHLAGAGAFVISNNYSNIPDTAFEYPLTDRPDWTVASNVTNQRANLQDPDEYTISSDWSPSSLRTLAPVRPHNTKINGVRNSTKVDVFLQNEVNVSWSTRSRKSPQIQFQADAAEESEVLSTGEYQYHVVTLRDSAGNEAEGERTLEGADITYNSLLATLPAAGLLYGDGWLYVKSKLTFTFGTLENIFDDMLPVQILPNGTKISEDGLNYILSEDGQSIIIQEEA